MIARRLQRLDEPADQVLTGRGRRARVRARAARGADRRARPSGIIAALEEAIARRADPRGRGRARPLRVRARARARGALRAPEREPARARCTTRIGEALEARRRREPGRARAPLLREARTAEKAVDYALAAAEQATAALAYEEAAEHYRRALGEPRARDCECCSRSAAPSCAPAIRRRATTFAAAAATLARARGDREALAAPRSASRAATPRPASIDRDGDRAARRGARRADSAASDSSARRASSRARLADALALRDRAAERTGAQPDGAGDGAPARRPRGAAGRAREPARRAAAHRRTSTSGSRSSEELLAAGRAGRRARARGARAPLAHLRPARGRPVEEARGAHTALAALAGQLRQPLYRHFAVGWEVVWAQMERARRRTPSGSRARRTSSAGARRPATPTRSTPPRCSMLRRREDGLADYVSTIERYVEREPARSSPGARSCRWRT